VERIREELTAEARGRKRRAIELAVALGAVEELHAQIVALLSDEDQYLRIEAIRALATHDGRATRDAIRDSLLDAQPLVRQTAEAALAELTRHDTVKLCADPQRDTVSVLPLPNAPPLAPRSVFDAGTQTPIGGAP
jgi:HEAT repeat protein